MPRTVPRNDQCAFSRASSPGHRGPNHAPRCLAYFALIGIHKPDGAQDCATRLPECVPPVIGTVRTYCRALKISVRGTVTRVHPCISGKS